MPKHAHFVPSHQSRPACGLGLLYLTPGGRKGDLSRFVEEAVRAHILALTAEQVKSANAHLSEADLTALVDEAVEWARDR
jgi:hypothetical protein